MTRHRRGWRALGGEWEQRDGVGFVLVVPSDTDPNGSEALRAQEAAAHDEADRLAAIMQAGGTIPNEYETERREAAE
jgi:hypothetical protein